MSLTPSNHLTSPETPTQTPLQTHQRIPYADVNEIPIPLRHTMIKLSRVHGMSAAAIAKHFELPVQWVMLFVDTQPGSTEH